MTSTRSLLKIILTALLAFALAFGGAWVSANLGPRVVRVARQAFAPAPAVSAPREFDALPDVIAAACPAVVAIAEGGPQARIPDPQRQESRATSSRDAPSRSIGFLISADGYVMMSAHDLSETGSLRIMLNDGRTLEARRAGVDRLSGLALLKVDGDDFPFLQFDASDLPRVGQWAVALAAPNASGCIAQAGIVGSDFIAEGAGRRSYVRMQPVLGDQFAGAPVLAQDGKIIAVAGLGGTTGSDEDVGAMLPAGMASRIVNSLLRSGGPPANSFGIAAQDLTPALAARISPDRQQGAVIALVEAHSPADRAGLRAGDIIFSVEGAPVAGASEFERSLDASRRSVTLDVMRRSQRLSVTLRSQ